MPLTVTAGPAPHTALQTHPVCSPPALPPNPPRLPSLSPPPQELAELGAYAGRRAGLPLSLGAVAGATHRLEVARMWAELLAHLAAQGAVPQVRARACGGRAGVWGVVEAMLPGLPT